MAKTKLSLYDSTAANNLDINSINIAEGMAPGDINNAIRELMAQLKNFLSGASGDSLVVGGTLSVTGAASFPGGLSGALSGNATSANSAGTANQISNATGWSVTPSRTSLYFNFNGTNVASLDSTGNLIVLGNVTAYGTV